MTNKKESTELEEQEFLLKSLKDSELTSLTIRDIVQGYKYNELTGEVIALNGRLNVRPPYQRQFVWDGGSLKGGIRQRKLIDTILKSCSIGLLHFVKTGVNEAGEDTYECLDGQQRIITICQFYNNQFQLRNHIQFSGLTDKSDFLDYNKFVIRVCESENYDDKMEWFERVNQEGMSLSKQEMRSALAVGPGTSLAKKYFIDTHDNGANAYSFGAQIGNPQYTGKDYVKGAWERQSIYEKVITWKKNSSDDEIIKAYMKNNKDNTEEAEALFSYFKDVITWVKTLFPTYNTDMKDVDWGKLYNQYHENDTLTAKSLEADIKALRNDIGNNNSSHLTSSKGIYEYVLAAANGVNNPSLLQRRVFSKKDKEFQYSRQHGICPHCHKHFRFINMNGDHIIPYHPIPESGVTNGTTTPDNLQMLCNHCNLEKTNKYFDSEAEKDELQKIYDMSEEEIAAVPEG